MKFDSEKSPTAMARRQLLAVCNNRNAGGEHACLSPEEHKARCELSVALAERDRWKEEYQSLCPIATEWENRAVRAEADLRERLGPAGAKMLSDLRERAEKAEAELAKWTSYKTHLDQTNVPELLALRAENERQADILRQCRNFVVPFAISAGMIPEETSDYAFGKAPGQTKSPWVTKAEWMRAIPLLEALNPKENA